MVGKDGIEQIEKRSLFLSHAHANRELSTHLQDFVQLVYSGLVETFVSSSPTAGIGSGEEWFQRIHVELRRAERVWVIATPVSVSHPWIYWEAGVGRALCEGGVTPVCVGISVEELPSPLNQFQAYDALANDGNNLRALAADVAAQMGMEVADVLLQNAMDTWLTQATRHEPTTQPADEATLSPEQVTQVDSLVSRLRPSVPCSQPVDELRSQSRAVATGGVPLIRTPTGRHL